MDALIVVAVLGWVMALGAIIGWRRTDRRLEAVIRNRITCRTVELRLVQPEGKLA